MTVPLATIDEPLTLIEEDLGARDESEQLVHAVADAYDAIVGLCDLARLQVSTLKQDDVIPKILEGACQLLRCDAALLAIPGCPVIVGNVGTRSSLLRKATAWFDGSRRTVEDRGAVCILEPVALVDKAAAPLALLRLDGRSFTSGDMKLVEAVAATIAGRVALTQLHRRAVEYAVVERDHAVASELAQSVLSAPTVTPENVDLFVRCLPARLAGGDFYAVRTINGEMRFAIGDVAGKGLPAALLMTRVVGACRIVFERTDLDGIVPMMQEIHHAVYQDLSELGLFSTLLIGAYRPGSGVVRICNAGHSPAMLLRPTEVCAIWPSVPPLGVLEECDASEQTLNVTKHDVLVLGSDGLTDQANAAGELFGGDRFRDLVMSGAGGGASALGEQIMATIDDYAGDTPGSDDRTLLILGFAAPVRTGERHATEIEATHLAVREVDPWLDVVLSDFPETSRPELKVRLNLAVHEICVNVVDHAYRGQGGRMELISERRYASLIITITDRGSPYDAASARRTTPGQALVRGFGLGIVEQLVDRLEYQRSNEINTWTLCVNTAQTQQEVL